MQPGVPILVAGGLVAGFCAFKPIYERFLRKDAPVDAETLPILKRMRRPLHGSHRGGANIFPENTMLAFRNAVRSKASSVRATDMLECDIQMTKDGHLVLMHNLDVKDTTDGVGLVRELTLEQIRALDAAYWFTRGGETGYPLRGTGVLVPTLEEFLSEFVPEADLLFYLDFKAVEPIEKTLELVTLHKIEDRVILGAVPPDVNRMLLARKPSMIPMTPDINSMITMVALYFTGLLWLYPMKHEIVGTTVHRWGHRILTPSLLKAFHKRHRLMAVFGEFLDTVDGQRECVAMGVDVLVSDRPDLLHEVVRDMKRPMIA